MNLDLVLFILRVLSAGFLLALLVALIIIVWRDYRISLMQTHANHRAYGFLTPLRELEGDLVVSGTPYTLALINTLGRAPTNSIVVSENSASNEHAMIYRRNGQWWLEDKKSRNGTTLNRHAVQQPIVITDGDIVGIGLLYFRLDLEK